MSEWKPQVVRIGRVGKHLNADSLSITHVLGNYPVIFRTGEYDEGDVACYVPVETIVPRRPEFEFLFTDPEQTTARVKARKLRGIFSMGLLVKPPGPPPLLIEGESIVDLFGLEHYQPELRFEQSGAIPGPETPIYDIEGLRANLDVLKSGTPVLITEKIHGANMRVMLGEDGAVYVGGRRQWLPLDGGSPYAIAARKLNLDRLTPGMCLYGEAYGRVQSLRYGLDNDIDVRFFDAFDTRHGCWVTASDLPRYVLDIGSHLAPQLFVGPFDPDVAFELAEGASVLGGGHVREGIVIRPLVESWDVRCGRVLFKLVGEGYLTHKAA